MIALHLPSFETPTAALDWLHERYEVIRVALLPGADGQIRGTALVRAKGAADLAGERAA